MTLKEWRDLDKRELSRKAMDFVAQSDQGIYDYVKDLDIDDLASINRELESLADAVNEDTI